MHGICGGLGAFIFFGFVAIGVAMAVYLMFLAPSDDSTKHSS